MYTHKARVLAALRRETVDRIPYVPRLDLWYLANSTGGLTFPIADWLMGTSDLDRGLVGHIFNGYSMKHVKPELRERIEKYVNVNDELGYAEPAAGQAA